MRIFRSGRAARLAPLAFSPDGRYLAAGTYEAKHGESGTFLWDTFGADEPCRAVDRFGKGVGFTPDSDALLIDESNGETELDIATGRESYTQRLTNYGAVRYSPDGRHRATAFFQNTKGWLKVQLSTREAGAWRDGPRPKLAHGGDGVGLDFAADGARLAVLARGELLDRGDARWHLHLVAPDTREVATAWAGRCSASVSAVRAGPGATWVALLVHEAFVAIAPGDAGRKPTRCADPAGVRIADLAFSPCGRRLATAAWGAVKFWDTASWSVAREYRWGIGRLRSVAFAPDGLRCAAGSDMGQVVVWDVEG